MQITAVSAETKPRRGPQGLSSNVANENEIATLLQPSAHCQLARLNRANLTLQISNLNTSNPKLEDTTLDYITALMKLVFCDHQRWRKANDIAMSRLCKQPIF